jgi:hypothetical protein
MDMALPTINADGSAGGFVTPDEFMEPDEVGAACESGGRSAFSG